MCVAHSVWVPTWGLRSFLKLSGALEPWGPGAQMAIPRHWAEERRAEELPEQRAANRLRWDSPGRTVTVVVFSHTQKIPSCSPIRRISIQGRNPIPQRESLWGVFAGLFGYVYFCHDPNPTQFIATHLRQLNPSRFPWGRAARATTCQVNSSKQEVCFKEYQGGMEGGKSARKWATSRTPCTCHFSILTAALWKRCCEHHMLQVRTEGLRLSSYLGQFTRWMWEAGSEWHMWTESLKTWLG